MKMPLLRRFLTPLLPGAVALAAAWFAAGCASAPPVVSPPPAATYEHKLSWILRFEDQRILGDAVSAAPAAAPAPAAAAGRRASSGTVIFATVPPPPVGLVPLLADADSRVRRRAALAIGRVGLHAGVGPLLEVLRTEPEPEVRQMVAFALGLLHDASAAAALRAALADPSPLVQGRAAEALGVLGDTASGSAIGDMIAAHARSGAVAAIAPDDVEETHAPPVEAFRLGVLALGRLKDYSALAAAVLGPSGEPTVKWWPVAAAFQRMEDRRAIGALLAFARGESRFGRAFAARGLGALKDPAFVDALAALARDWPRDTRAAISAVKALAAIGDRRAGPVLLELLKVKGLDPLLYTEVVLALGPTKTAGAVDLLLDLATSRSPAVRAAVFKSLRAIDPQSFLFVLSGLDSDRDWTVRAELATVMGTLEPENAVARLTSMLHDQDVRVLPPVLAALVKVHAPKVEELLLQSLKHADVVVRASAAAGLGTLKPPGGDRALIDAFHAAAADESYGARAAALDALVKYGPGVATPLLREALTDKDWALRVHAAELLAPLDPSTDPRLAIRPAPTGRAASFYDAADLVAPAVSPHVYIETERGTIQIELGVLDAPLTCMNFVTLARSGFFKNAEWHRVVSNFVVQDGDPRGDGEGGPGYTIRDEINERPYLRGTMGMALEWADTGGSQFFLTHSPQPHLDGRYTVFGQVVAGADVLDRIQPHDKILHVRVWDGKTWGGM
jgi:cyclophilin family peptidyl-prolyl cis-trans isomerase/HEAT repeat protein